MTHASVAGTDLEVPGRPDPAQRRHRDRRGPDRRPRPCPRLTAPGSRSASTSGRRSPRRSSSTSTQGRIVARRRTAPPPRPIDDRRPRRVRRLPGRARPAGPAGGDRRGAGLLQRGRRPADRGGRQRGAGHGRGRPPGRAVQRRQGRHASSRWPTAATSRDLGRPRRRAAHRRHRRRQQRGAPRGRPRPGRGGLARARSWSPATSTRRREVAAILAGLPHVLADNVVPRIGVLAPESARAAIREMFLAHVIGGKHLSSRADFTDDGPRRHPRRRAHRGRAAGPRGRRRRGRRRRRRHHRRALGGRGRPRAAVGREVVATTPVTRTVEGDLGMRWSALTTVAEPSRPRGGRRGAGTTTRASCPTPTPSATPTRRSPGSRSAPRCAGTPAAPGRGQPGGPGRRAHRQRPARGRPAGRLGRGAAPRPPRGRRAGPRPAAPARSRAAGSCPRAPRVVVDTDYVLAAAGLLAGATHPRRRAAGRLAGRWHA